MSAFGLRSLALLAAALLPALPAATSITFQDPLGAFSLPIPAGWTSDPPHFHGAGAYSGTAFMVIFYIDDAAAHPGLLAKCKGFIWPQFRDHRLLRTGAAQLGNASGSFEIYSGTRKEGAECIVRMVTAQVGADVVLMQSYSPTADWNKWKTDFGTMERGLRFRDAAGAGPR